MNKQMRKIMAGARREAQKAQGAFDGRFGHKVFTDQKKRSDRLLCREEVEFDQGQQEALAEIPPSSHRL